MVENINKRNPVYFAAQEAWDRYGNHLDGLLAGPVCVVSERTLPDVAKSALDASAAQLGYGEHAITYITLWSQDESDASRPLSAKQIFGLVESIDPMVVIGADAQSVATLSRAYQADFPRDKATRLLGRTAVGFADFPAMLTSTEDKQKAWAHLKRLGNKPKPR